MLTGHVAAASPSPLASVSISVSLYHRWGPLQHEPLPIFGQSTQIGGASERVGCEVRGRWGAAQVHPVALSL